MLEDLEDRLHQLEHLDVVLRNELHACDAPDETSPAEQPNDVHDAVQDPAEPVQMRAQASADARPGKHPCLPPLDYTTTDTSPRKTVDLGSGREGEQVAESDPPAPPPEPTARPARVPVDAFWDILPDRIRDWLHEPHANWPDIVDAAQRAAGGLGISDHAWRAACEALGRRDAAIAVSIIAIKHDQGLIHSPGGYLRGMTAKRQTGELDLNATIFGLQDRKRRPAPSGAPRRGAAE